MAELAAKYVELNRIDELLHVFSYWVDCAFLDSAILEHCNFVCAECVIHKGWGIMYKKYLHYLSLWWCLLTAWIETVAGKFQVDKQTTRCPRRRVLGITCNADPCSIQGLLGGWSSFIYLPPNTKIIRLPQALPASVFMAGGCGYEPRPVTNLCYHSLINFPSLMFVAPGYSRQALYLLTTWKHL